MTITRVSKRRARPKSIAPGLPTQNGVTVADLLKRLGGVPASRVRLYPTPGTATEKDVINVLDRENRPCELVEGTLVEKATGFDESGIAVNTIVFITSFVRRQNLGIVTGEAGTIRLFAGLVRIPDVAFTSWDRLPGRKWPKDPIPHLAPDLVVEVLSKSNTKSEMDRKLREYFAACVRLVWIVDPKKRTVRVYTALDQSILLDENQSLDAAPPCCPASSSKRTMCSPKTSREGWAEPKSKRAAHGVCLLQRSLVPHSDGEGAGGDKPGRRHHPRERSRSALAQFVFPTLPFQAAITSSLPRRGMPFSLMSDSVASSMALRRKTIVSL